MTINEKHVTAADLLRIAGIKKPQCYFVAKSIDIENEIPLACQRALGRFKEP